MSFQVHHKERFYFNLMVIISIMVYAAFGYFCYRNPRMLLDLLICGSLFSLFQWVMSYFLLGFIRGNAIRVSEEQFPAIYSITKQYAESLGLSRVPQVYLLQAGGILNAFAIKLARKNFVVLHSSVLQLAYEKQVDAVSFIIGHELGHIKRKHIYRLQLFFTLPGRFIPFLSNAYSRACEYTCDAIGYSLCPEGATDGIALLAAGEKLFKQVNLAALETKGFAITFAEIFATHPALVRRLQALNELRQQDIQKEGMQRFVKAAGNTKSTQIEK